MPDIPDVGDLMALFQALHKLEDAKLWKGKKGDTALAEVTKVDFGIGNAGGASLICKFWFKETPGGPEIQLRGEISIKDKEKIEIISGGTTTQVTDDNVTVSPVFSHNSLTSAGVKYEGKNGGTSINYSFRTEAAA